MGKERKVELACAAASTVIDALVVIFARPFPPLLSWNHSPGWSRAIEFAVILLIAWTLLSAIDLMKLRVSFGKDNVSFGRDKQAPVPEQDARRARTEASELSDLLQLLYRQVQRIEAALRREERIEPPRLPATPTPELQPPDDEAPDA